MTTLREIDDDMVVLHWNEQTKVWEPVRWDDWMSFRGLGDAFRPLLNVRAGFHTFVVCVVDEDRSLYNILPHRYRIDGDGRITDHNFSDLTDEDLAFVAKWDLSRVVATGADAERYDNLRLRLWRSWLPEPEAARALIDNLPGFPKTDEERPVMSFLREFGMVPSGRSSNAVH